MESNANANGERMATGHTPDQKFLEIVASFAQRPFRSH